MKLRLPQLLVYEKPPTRQVPWAAHAWKQHTSQVKIPPALGGVQKFLPQHSLFQHSHLTLSMEAAEHVTHFHQVHHFL